MRNVKSFQDVDKTIVHALPCPLSTILYILIKGRDIKETGDWQTYLPIDIKYITPSWLSV